MYQKAKRALFAALLSLPGLLCTDAIAQVKFSAIASGGSVASSTDKLLAVRSGTSDVLVTVGSSCVENLTSIVVDNGAGGLTLGAGQVTNAMLANASTTVNGQTCTLGSTCTITASGGVSSFTGDGTLLSNSASMGAVTATLAVAAADTIYGNNTTSSAAPTFNNTPAIGSTSAAASFTINTNLNGGMTLKSSSNLGPAFTLNATSGHNFQFYSTGSSNSPGNFGVYDATTNCTPFSVYGGSSVGNGTAVYVNGIGVLGFSADARSSSTLPDSAFSRENPGVMDVGTGASGSTGGALKGAGYMVGGTKFTTSGCSVSSTTGGATAGKFTLGANSCTVVITMNGATGLVAPNGWACSASDQTSSLIPVETSASNTTTASLNIPVTAGATDVISFSCIGY